MNANLKFYRVPFAAEQNKLIEGISFYLANKRQADSLESEYVKYIGEKSNFQFQKHALDLEIKIIDTELFTPLFEANYVAIYNNDDGDRYSRTYYYFIQSIQSVSESCLKLKLRMDTLNTFESAITNTNNWLDGTMVEREHRDRFWQTSSILPRTIQANKYARKIDRISEGLDFPLLRKSKTKITDTLDSKFYLVYRSAFIEQAADTEDQSKNAIKCFLLAEKGKQIPMMNYHGNAIDIDLLDNVFALLTNVEDTLIFDSDENPELFFSKGRETYETRQDDRVRYMSTDFKQALRANCRGLFGVRKISSSSYQFFTILFRKGKSDTYTTIKQSTSPIGAHESTDPADKFIGGCCCWSEDVPQTTTTQLYYNYFYQSESGFDAIHSATISGATLKTFPINGVRKARIFNFQSSEWGSLTASYYLNLPYILRSIQNWDENKIAEMVREVDYQDNAGIDNMMTIDELDRTDSRLIKIIELPYAPNTPIAHGTGANLYYTFGNNWSASADIDYNDLDMVRAFQLVGDIEPEFSHYLSSKFEINGVRNVGNNTASPLMPFNIENESKLYHSSFYKEELLYDNFTLSIELENLFGTHNYWFDNEWMASGDTLDLDIQLTCSSNITNGLLFELDAISSDISIVNSYYKSEQEYPLTLVAIRNNEVNLYNSSYLQYIRSGYNYDVKNKALSLRASQIQYRTQYVTGMTSGFASLASGVLSGSAPTAVGGLASMFNAWFSYEQNKKLLDIQGRQQANEISKTLAQNALQGTSVAGSDNLSLFNKYNGNKAYHCIFQIADEFREKVGRLFHYFGYATNKYKIPALTGRTFFNYVKCMPMFKNELSVYAFEEPQQSPLPTLYTYGSSQEIVADIVSKFNNGVFIIHDQELISGTAGQKNWNTSMDKENWEEFITANWPEVPQEEEVEENA